MLFGLLASASLFAAETLVSPFAGSELIGEYETDFERLTIADATSGEQEIVAHEGKLISHFYKKPAAKSTLEVYRSYQKELQASGFKILAAYSTAEGNVRRLGTQLNGKQGNNLSARPYQLDGNANAAGERSWLSSFAEHYISATKQQGDAAYFVTVVIADRRDLYAVDVLQTAAMETGTVSVTLELLKSKIEAEGRIAIYDILFDTGSAAIRPESEAALETIAAYIKGSATRRFYIVGHTDDTGSLESNMKLSHDRAESTVGALTSKYDVGAASLSAHGVGALSPVAGNTTENGRQLNRRVELVLRLEGN